MRPLPVLAALAGALVFAAPAVAACAKPASQAALETQLVCPTCHTTLDLSNAPVALQMKAEIRRLVAACKTESQVRAAMVEGYGPTVLSTPQTRGFDLIAWVLPLGGAALGAAALAAGARKWSRVRSLPAGAPPVLAADDERRVDEALARFDD